MPTDIIIKVKCDAYLVRFLESLYGKSPIIFPKNSNFLNILDVFLDKPPLDFVEPDYGEKTLKIQLMYCDAKNVLYNNYLSPLKQRIFVKEIWKLFKITFRGDIAQHLVNGLERQDAIELFIEKHNLSQDCWDQLEKDFQRYVIIRRKRRLFRNRKNTSDKEGICPPDLSHAVMEQSEQS